MKSRLIQFLLVVAFAAVISLLLVSSCGSDNPQAAPSPEAKPSPTDSAPASPAQTAQPSQTPEAQPSQTPEAQPSDTPTAEPSPTQAASPAPAQTSAQPATPTPDTATPSPDDPSQTDSPRNPGSTAPYAERVDDEWFSDAAFLGNSLVDGFRLFSGLTTCDVYAATSLTVLGAGSLISQMNAKQYGKVYILLGINEIGYDPDYFKTQYAGMLDTIIAGQPDADIYVMGLTPVSEHKSTTDSTFTMDRVRAYNDRLLALAIEKGCYYLDLCEALANEDGYLPADVTTDGVHFAASHYQVWLEYLRTHHA